MKIRPAAAAATPAARKRVDEVIVKSLPLCEFPSVPFEARCQRIALAPASLDHVLARALRYTAAGLSSD